MAYAGEYETTYNPGGGSATYGEQDPSNPPPGFRWDARTGTFVPITQPEDPTQTPTAPEIPAIPAITGGGVAGPDPGGNITTIGQGLLSPFTGGAMPTPPSGTGFIPQTPNYTAPTFTAPAYKTPPPFELPTFEQAGDDPGYRFTTNEGQRALEQSAAARGLANTGGTAKDLTRYGQAAASTQYGAVLNRLLNQYLTNVQTQYNQPYEYAYRAATDSFAPQMAQFGANVGAGNLGYSTQASAGQRSGEFNYNALMNQYIQRFNEFQDQRDSTFSKTFNYLTAE